MPGLPDSRSQLAVPIAVGRALSAVLYVERRARPALRLRRRGRAGGSWPRCSARDAQHAGAAPTPRRTPRRRAPARPRLQGAAVTVRHYAADDSVFLGDDYLIKGVAGAILWKLAARPCAASGRTEFTNRELRLDPLDPPARSRRQPRSAPHPPLAEACRARAAPCDRKDRTRPLPLLREATGRHGRGGGCRTLIRPRTLRRSAALRDSVRPRAPGTAC